MRGAAILLLGAILLSVARKSFSLPRFARSDGSGEVVPGEEDLVPRRTSINENPPKEEDEFVDVDFDEGPDRGSEPEINGRKRPGVVNDKKPVEDIDDEDDKVIPEGDESEEGVKILGKEDENEPSIEEDGKEPSIEDDKKEPSPDEDENDDEEDENESIDDKDEDENEETNLGGPGKTLIDEEQLKKKIPDQTGYDLRSMLGYPFRGGFYYDFPFFNLRQMSKYFQQLERALEHVFKQTMDEALLLNGTFGNTTEEVEEINGKKYLITKSILKGKTDNSSVYIEAISALPAGNKTKVTKEGGL